MASLPQNNDAFGCEGEEAKGRVMWKTLSQGPEAKRLGVSGLGKKAKEAFEPRKELNGFTGSRGKPSRKKQGEIYIVLVSSAHCYSREKKYESH